MARAAGGWRAVVRGLLSLATAKRLGPALILKQHGGWGAAASGLALETTGRSSVAWPDRGEAWVNGSVPDNSRVHNDERKIRGSQKKKKNRDDFLCRCGHKGKLCC